MQKYLASSGREVQGSLARILYEKNGPEVLPLIESLFRELGTVEGQKMKKKLQGKDFTTAIKTFFTPAMEAKPPRAEIVELTDEKVVVKGYKCVMGLYGAGMEVCQAIMALDQAMLSNLTGKNLSMKIIKTMAAGDDYCLIEFKVESECT